MTRLNEFIVGVVFIFAMSVLGYFTIIKGELFDSRKFYYITAIFANVDGLAMGDKVMVNGVPAGTVVLTDLLEDCTVRVKMKMYLQFRLYENYRIDLRNQTALGGKTVYINPGKPETEGRFFEEVMTRTDLAGVSLGDPISMIAEMLDENRENIKIGISNFSEFAQKMNTGKGTIAKLVNEDTLHDETGRLMKEIRDTIEDSREQAPVTSFIRAALTIF